MNCDLCHAELVPVYPDLSRRRDDDQFDGCLHLVLEGGYGEYVDNLCCLHHYRLCSHCADSLMQREPWMRGGVT